HQVDDDPDAALLGLVHELDKIPAGTMAGIDAVVVADIVAIVLVRRWLKRSQPDRVDTQRMQIIEATLKPFKVAYAVTVQIHEGFQIEAVNDGVFVPEIFNHRWLSNTELVNALNGLNSEAT